MREVLARIVHQMERRQCALKIPQEVARLQKHRDMHFHYKPEIFVQIHGTSSFQTPREKFVLRPGEVGILPAGVPHSERIETDPQGRFRNLVIGYYSNTLSVHFAHEVAPGKPDIEAIEFFDMPNLDFFVTLTNQLATAFHTAAPAREQIIRGMFLALVGMLQSVVETGGGRLNRDIGKIFQTKWIVREQMSNPALNVKGIAERLQCSPDYLSHLFHQETGEKLIHYIQRMRMEGAMLALESTNLYISEIAWSSGYQDPAYFARVFRKFTGESPQSYRDRLEAKRQEREEAPKTIYFDHDDYTYGEPVAAWH
jgi:AraC-like DNA-binding protein